MPPEPQTLDVPLRRLDPDLPVPVQARPGDAGVDLHLREDVRIGPGERTMVGTGIALAVPEGYAAFVHPRSGLAARHGLTIVNAPGTVDSGYRGEILVNLLNTDPREPVQLRRGDRIAQLVLQQVARPVFTVVDDLGESERGAGGHGHTGTSTPLPAAAGPTLKD
ncbi:MAG: dUTP diphosphatase [Arsenicicoccus sp.]|nr:MAG: dUTP diphosphatase [Arsenicicoccus sp.]